jgi:hypothetical protein
VAISKKLIPIHFAAFAAVELVNTNLKITP